MTAYTWPRSKGAREADDPGGRAAFLAPRRADLDLEGALEVSRLGPVPSPRRRGQPLAAPAAGASLLWLPLGPGTVTHGQAIGSPRVAGRVRALAVQADGERVYAAAANGGIWYSDDAGASWTSIGGLAPTPAIGAPRSANRNACGAIFVTFGGPAKADAGSDVVFVGTGEPGEQSAQPGGHLGGVGVYVATGPAASGAADPWVLEATNLADAGIYRIAQEPGGATVVAATTKGLFQRVASADWTPVAGDPFHDFTGRCTDVLWTDATGAAPKRLWAWIETGDKAGLWVRDDGVTNFRNVDTPNAHRQRTVLAAATPPATVYVFNDRYVKNATAPVLNALFQVGNATAALPVATAVAGVPDVLQTQGFYDIAMAVDPSDPTLVVLGGSFAPVLDPAGANSDNDGAIFSAKVAGAPLTYGSPAAPTMIGIGVHADVHSVTFAKNGARLFATCDGGIYRSDRPRQGAGFVACNNGLSVIEANYIAAHPTCEGYIACGLQDNGVIERSSNDVWRHTGDGDGGGIVLDPLRPDRFVRQFFNGQWTPGDPLTRAGSVPVAAGGELSDSSFYATPAAIKHDRGGGVVTLDVGQLLIPTTRVWYSEDFGTTWLTLPTATDALLPAYNANQDTFSEAVLVCRWQTSNVAWALGETQVRRFERVAGSDNTGGPGTWGSSTLITKTLKNKKNATSAEGPLRKATFWTDIGVNLDAGGVAHGSKGAVYIGTTGHPDDEDVDTLWWFDGESKWWPTGLRKQRASDVTPPNTGGVPAPVTAVLADPAHPDTVYVGTTVGVWKGVRTLHGSDAPTWVWTSMLNGLPEASIEDLALFDDGGLRLLRAGVVSRGVWEVRLDSDATDLTYLRAHDDDLRYRARAVEKQRDLVTDRSWHGSPDLRPRLGPRSGTAPADLPWTFSKPAVRLEDLRRFQSAFRSKFAEPRCRPTGEWDRYFEEVLRDHGVPVVAGLATIDAPFWQTVMQQAADATAEPWGATTPTEADLVDFTPALTEGTLAAASTHLPARPWKVDVLVHRRGPDPVDGGQVLVTLLRWIDPRTRNRASAGDSTTWPTTAVPWAQAVNDVLNSSGATTAVSLAGTGWAFMGTTAAARRKTLTGQTLDNTRSAIATFDLDTTAFVANRLVLLAAVMRDGTPSAIAPAALQELALTDPHIAVRSVRIG